MPDDSDLTMEGKSAHESQASLMSAEEAWGDAQQLANVLKQNSLKAKPASGAEESQMLEHIATALAQYHVVLEPDEDTPEWWAGAPSVVLSEDGTFYLASRMREGRSPRGRRGYEIRTLQSTNGYDFKPIHHIHRDARCARVRAPRLATRSGDGPV